MTGLYLCAILTGISLGERIDSMIQKNQELTPMLHWLAISQLLFLFCSTHIHPIPLSLYATRSPVWYPASKRFTKMKRTNHTLITDMRVNYAD